MGERAEMSFVYLASPYSHQCPSVMHLRFISACRAAGKPMEQGLVVFAPICHSHPIAEEMRGRHTDHAFWMAQDLPILAHADRLVVLQLDGWVESRGIAEEITFARWNGIPVEYMEP